MKSAAPGRKGRRQAGWLHWSPACSWKHLVSGVVMAAAELSSTVGLRQDRVTERWKGETTTTEREIDKHPSRKNDWSAFAKKKKKTTNHYKLKIVSPWYFIRKSLWDQICKEHLGSIHWNISLLVSVHTVTFSFQSSYICVLLPYTDALYAP